jgi:hypothetical protein
VIEKDQCLFVFFLSIITKSNTLKNSLNIHNVVELLCAKEDKVLANYPFHQDLPPGRPPLA